MPESLAEVWTAVSSFFSTALSGALETITAIPILTAPLVIWVASKVLGQGKSLLKISSRRR